MKSTVRSGMLISLSQETGKIHIQTKVLTSSRYMTTGKPSKVIFSLSFSLIHCKFRIVKFHFNTVNERRVMYIISFDYIQYIE